MKILFVCGRFPYPPMRGDMSVPYNRIKCLAQRHDITLLSMVSTERDLQHIGELQTYCGKIETIQLPAWRSVANMAVNVLRNTPLQVSYYRSAEFARKFSDLAARNRFDVVHVTLSRMAPYVLNSRDSVRVVDMIDALSLNMERRAAVERGPMRALFKEEARRMRRFERRVCSSVDHVTVVSDTDKQHLGSPNVSCIPIGTDPIHHVRRTDGRTVAFSGNFGYFPNAHGAAFFLREVMPLLVHAKPDIRVRFIGMNPTDEMVRLAAPFKQNVEITGFVAAVTKELLGADVAICPLRTGGAGMHLKIIEALASGVPIVASPLVTGFDTEMLRAVTPDEWVAAILAVLRDPALASRLSIRGREAVEAKYSWRSTTEQLEHLFTELVKSRKRNGSAPFENVQPFPELVAD